ncbi:hypothetical protein [Pontibacter ummariensis]|nr:hypothetical protein [Pontibacter ummariensis]
MEFYRLVAPFVTSFKDGHTSVSVELKNEDLEEYVRAGGTFFPLEIATIDNRLYCKSNPSSAGTIKRGDEILSINKEPRIS